MLSFNAIGHEMARGNALLVLLIDVVIETHNYEDMEPFRKRLAELK